MFRLGAGEMCRLDGRLEAGEVMRLQEEVGEGVRVCKTGGDVDEIGMEF